MGLLKKELIGYRILPVDFCRRPPFASMGRPFASGYLVLTKYLGVYGLTNVCSKPGRNFMKFSWLFVISNKRFVWRQRVKLISLLLHAICDLSQGTSAGINDVEDHLTVCIVLSFMPLFSVVIHSDRRSFLCITSLVQT